MNLFNFFSRDPAYDLVSGTFDPFTAAMTSSTRTNTTGMPFDSRRELTHFRRREMVKKGRWLYNNLGLISRFVKGTSRYSVGGGIVPVPTTGDEDFDKVLLDYFINWAETPAVCDVRQRFTFWRMQKAALRSMFKDGESFFLKAPAPDEVLVDGLPPIMGLPSLQWLETQHIGNLGYDSEGWDPQDFRDGIRIDFKTGAVTDYSMLEDMNPRAMDMRRRVIIPSDAMLHVFDPERASQNRGLPWYYHGQNSALDIIDLTALEKHAAKIHAAMAAAIKKRSGEAGPKGFTGNLDKKQRVGADGKTRIISFENFIGGAGILQMGLDEELQLLTSNRPSMTFTGFIDYLVRDLAWGFGVSPEFIWAVADLSGPNARVILEDAKWFFEEVQDLLVQIFCVPVYMWVVARGIERGEIKVPANVVNPYAAHWQGPAKLTIDEGKVGMIELERLANGCGTWEDYWGARGRNGRTMVRRRIDEVADAIKYAEQKKVPFDYIIQLNMGGTGGPNDLQPKQTPSPNGAPKPGQKGGRRQALISALMAELATNAVDDEE